MTNRAYLEATNDVLLVPAQMLNDYRHFFAVAELDVAYPWAGGTIIRLNSHGASQGELTAVFKDAADQSFSMTYWSNLSDLARNSVAIGRQWKEQYGFNPDAGLANKGK